MNWLTDKLGSLGAPGAWIVSHGPQATLLLATVLGGLGMWLMLPRGNAGGRRLGALLAALAGVVYGSQLVPVGSDEWFSEAVFLILAAVTVISAACTITFRNPVYSAIWFALTLLGTAALFLFQGAQFLALATVVVYAGAILVTFLFVLMLANPKGHAYYDRVSWEAFLSATAGAVMVGILSITLMKAFTTSPDAPKLQPPSAEALEKDILNTEHVAHLGAHLFSEYLIAIEVAGTLLLVALVAAVSIVGLDESSRRAERAHDFHG
ncbi:MAG: NADH-quinone oxidoreductase subunit J [Pirellulales bacterium]|nr:NADH-quinone oxidoreductase subunit J [Pirellulales bacterium]